MELVKYPLVGPFTCLNTTYIIRLFRAANTRLNGGRLINEVIISTQGTFFHVAKPAI